jgi:hypothetical protein
MVWTARVRFSGLDEATWVGFDDETSIPQSLDHALMAICNLRNKRFILGWWVRVPD